MKHSLLSLLRGTQRSRFLPGISGSLIALMMLLATRATASVDVVVSEYQVDFTVGINNNGVVLTVSGDDFVWRHDFGPGDPVALSIYESDGSTLPDGVYHWQLEVLPDPDVAANLAIASTLNNQGEGDAISWPTQSGAVAIAGGTFVSPAVAEPGEAGNTDQQSSQVFGDDDVEQEDSDD